MCNKWIGRKGQNFVKDEQNQQIARPGNRHCRMHRHRIKCSKAGLVFFVIAPHIADCVKRRQSPQARGDKAKNGAKRCHRKLNRQTVRNLGDKQTWRLASMHRQRNMQRRNKCHHTANRPGGVTPQVPYRQKRCQNSHHKRRQNANQQSCLRCHHKPPPISAAAAARDADTSQLASTPNQILPRATIHNGR